MVHLLVEGPAVFEARPNMDSNGPDLVGVGFSASVEEYLRWWLVRRGVRERRGVDRGERAPHSLWANI